MLPSGSAAALMKLLLPFLPDPETLAPKDVRRALLYSVGANLLVGRKGDLSVFGQA